MRIFKTKGFHRWTKEIKLSDYKLKEAVTEIGSGLYDANLGGGIFKKRISLGSRGKSSGARTILAFGVDKNVFFIYGFEKNVRSNISEHEEMALKKLAKLYFSFSDRKLAQAVYLGELIEVN